MSAKVKEAFTTLYSSMIHPDEYIADLLETYGVTDVDINLLEEVSKFYDAQLPPEKQHEWSSWFYMADHDVVQRTCTLKGCEGELRITGQVLSSLNHNQNLNLLEHIWKNVAPHTIEPPWTEDSIYQHFPGAAEVPSTAAIEPPEFTEETYERIIEWLNTPFQQFKGNIPEFWELRVITDYSMPTGKAVTEVDSMFITGPIIPSYYTTIVRRVPVILQDDRYFMEVAIRHDTGEPVATCNHQGSFQQYMAELQGQEF